MCLVPVVEVAAVLWQPSGYQLGILILAEQLAAVGRILESPASYCAANIHKAAYFSASIPLLFLQ